MQWGQVSSRSPVIEKRRLDKMLQGKIAGCFVAGVIRNSGAGWGYIDDAGHKPLRFGGAVSPLVAPDDYKLELLHPTTSEGVSRVGALLAVPDETLCKLGFAVGASVGKDASYLQAAMPLRFRTFGRAAVGDVHSFFGSMVSIASLGDNTGYRATVPNLQPSSNPVIATARHIDGRCASVRVANVSSTQFDVVAYCNLGGNVSWSSGTDFVVGSANVGVTATWNTDTLTVSHPTGHSSSLSVSLTGYYNGYTPKIYSSAANQFQVRFYDSAGTLMTVPNGSMRFQFERNLELPCLMNDSQHVYIDAGMALLYWDNIVSANGNIWLLGLMYDDL